jgi:hypothetical protein
MEHCFSLIQFNQAVCIRQSLFSILLFRFLPFVKKGVGMQVPPLNSFRKPVFRVSLEDVTGSPGNRVPYKVDGATFGVQNTRKILKNK